MLQNWYKTASDDLLPSLTDDDISKVVKDLVPEQPPQVAPSAPITKPVKAPVSPSQSPIPPLSSDLIRRWESYCREMESSGDLEANPDDEEITEMAQDIAYEAWTNAHPGEDEPSDEETERIHGVIEALENHYWAWRNRRIERSRRRR